MAFDLPLPPAATWVHRDARTGFEVVYFSSGDGGHHVTGSTAAVEDGHAWVVDYEIDLGPDWVTQRAVVTSRTVDGARTISLDADEPGRWRVDGLRAPHLDGCLDVDLESSAMTNAFPVHRLGLGLGDRSPAPAVYVRAVNLSVERLEQTYERRPGEDGHHVYAYEAPAFHVACRLTYDESGLVIGYPGIAERTS